MKIDHTRYSSERLRGVLTYIIWFTHIHIVDDDVRNSRHYYKSV